MNFYKLHSKPESLDHHDTAFEKIPKLVWEKYWHQPEELKKRENLLAKDPEVAYFYALDVLEGPFPAGETAIAKSPFWSFYYACDVLKGPFTAGEAAIASDPHWAYYYALKMLKLPEVEAKVWGKN